MSNLKELETKARSNLLTYEISSGALDDKVGRAYWTGYLDALSDVRKSRALEKERAVGKILDALDDLEAFAEG